MPAPTDTYGEAIYNTAGLVGYWRLGDTSGTTATDSSSAARNGTYTGAYALNNPGALGTTGDKSVLVNNGYITVPHNAAYNLTGDMTVEAWVYPTSITTYRMIVTKANTNATPTFELRLVQSTGMLEFVQWNGTTYYTIAGTVQVSGNRWNHVAAVRAGNNILLYLNGLLVGTGTVSGAASTNTSALLIGERVDLGLYYFAGGIDEVALYNVALSPQAITSRYAIASTVTLPPNVIVEVAFHADPMATGWSDITSKVQQISIRRGRDDELARYQAGTATVVVDNRLRWFDPLYDSGPYYPYVLPGRRMRIRAGTPNTFTLFDGYIEAWPQSWEAQRAARVHITAVDAFKMLNLRRLPAAYAAVVKSHSPTGYWRFDETSGAVAADSSGNGNNWTYIGTPTYGTNAALFSDTASKSVRIGYPTSYVHSAATPTLGALSSFTLEVWALPASVPVSSFGAIAIRGVDGQAGHIGMFQSNTGVIHFTMTTSTIIGTVYFADSPTGYFDGAFHHLVGTWDGSLMRLYVDGAQVITAATTGTLQTATAPWHMGVMYGGPWTWDGYVDEMAYYENQVLTAAQIRDHYVAGRGFPSQTSAARVSAVLQEVGWPSAELTLNGGTQMLQASTPNGSTALDHLQATSDTEAGRLFVTAAGKVRFDGRNTFFLPPYTSTLATFGDNPLDPTEHKYVDLVVSYDDTQIWNDVRLTRTAGVEQVSGDTASQAMYGTRTLSKSGLLHTTDASVLSQAQYLRNQYKDPHLRVLRLAIRPGRRAELWQQVLARDIGDRVRVGRRPQGLPPAIAQDSWIEGVEHDITPGSWETRWTLSPADIATVWILGDATAGVLGTTTILSF